MARQTEHGITYVDETWNPMRGCDPNMPCAPNCWARRMAVRHEGVSTLPHLHGFVDRERCEVTLWDHNSRMLATGIGPDVRTALNFATEKMLCG